MMGPTIPYYYAIVLGTSVVLLIGLNSEESEIVDNKTTSN